MDLAEDFDELTQSSDTATEDTDSPTSGYRHASLLIQKLDSATLGRIKFVLIQNKLLLLNCQECIIYHFLQFIYPDFIWLSV